MLFSFSSSLVAFISHQSDQRKGPSQCFGGKRSESSCAPNYLIFFLSEVLKRKDEHYTQCLKLISTHKLIIKSLNDNSLLLRCLNLRFYFYNITYSEVFFRFNCLVLVCYDNCVCPPFISQLTTPSHLHSTDMMNKFENVF